MFIPADAYSVKKSKERQKLTEKMSTPRGQETVTRAAFGRMNIFLLNIQHPKGRKTGTGHELDGSPLAFQCSQPTNQPTKKLTKGGVLRMALGIVPC
jgi:hypothetical protein